MNVSGKEGDTPSIRTIPANPFENMNDGYWYAILVISHILFVLIPISVVVYIIYTDYGSVEAIVRGWARLNAEVDSGASTGADAKLVMYPLAFGISAGIGAILFYLGIIRIYFRVNGYPPSEDLSIGEAIAKTIAFAIIGTTLIGTFGYFGFGIVGAVVGLPFVSVFDIPEELVLFASLTIGFHILGYYSGHFIALSRNSSWRETDQAMQEVERARKHAATADQKFERDDLRDAIKNITAAESLLESARERSDNAGVRKEIEIIEVNLQSNTEQIETELVDRELEAIYDEVEGHEDSLHDEEQQPTSVIEHNSQTSSDEHIQMGSESVGNSSVSSAEATDVSHSSETSVDLEKQLDMAATHLEKTESRISDGDLETAKDQLSRAENHFTQAENNTSTFPGRYHQLRNRAQLLRSLIDNPDRVTSNLDTAEDCLDRASSNLSHNDVLAAKKQLATAKGRLTRVERLLEDTGLPQSDRYESLRSRCESLQKSITDVQIREPLELAADCLEEGESSRSNGDLDTARKQLTEAKTRLDGVEQAPPETPDRYEQLRERCDELRASIDGRERITSHLDTATECLDSASSHLSTGDFDDAKTQLATAKGRLTRAENTADEYDVALPSRYETLQNRCTNLDESLTKTKEIEEPLEKAATGLDACEAHLSRGNIETAQDQVLKAEEYLAQVEAADTVLPDDYEQLRARSDVLVDLVDEPQGITAQLDTTVEHLDSVSSQLPDGDLGTASEQLSAAGDTLSKIDADFDGLSVTPPPRHADLQTRCDSLENTIEGLQTAQSRFETAADCLESSKTHLQEREFEAAKTQLSTAKGRITQAENELEQWDIATPERLETLRSRCTSMADTIETERHRVQAEDAVTTAIEAMDAGYDAYDNGDFATATSNFETVPGHLSTVREASVEPADLSSNLAPETVAAETARGRVYVAMQRAEQRIADGHEALEDRDHEAAVEAYEDALSHLRTATGVASDHELPQTWELDQRQETVAAYLDNAKDQRDAADENRLETAAQRLDRATRLAETAEQHLEVDDSVAAWDDIQQARDVVDDAFELLAGTAANTADLEQRASKLSGRIETTAADIPEQVRMEGTTASASKRELFTYLQELSVIFGESPSEDFVDAYGVYPATTYLDVFGSWEDALDEANLAPIDEQARERRVYSRADILDAIVDLAEMVDSVPTPEQMNEQGAVSTPTVEKRFDTWEAAVQMAGIETQPTLDTIRALAGAGDVATSKSDDAETPETSVDADQESGSSDDETETEPDVPEQASSQDSTRTDDTAGETTDTDVSAAETEHEDPALNTGEFAELTNFHRDILVILAGLEGVKGLRIKEELETYYDDKVNHGRLYPNLDTLAERRFIEKFAIDNRSNGYRLTEKGNRHLQSRQQWEEAHTPGGEQPDRPAGRSDTANAEKTDSDTDTAETKADDTDTPTDSETADAEVTDEVDDLVDDLLADIEEMEDDTT